jgi:hypothetical protein
VLWQQRQHQRTLLDRALHALTSLQADVDNLLAASSSRTQPAQLAAAVAAVNTDQQELKSITIAGDDKLPLLADSAEEDPPAQDGWSIKAGRPDDDAPGAQQQQQQQQGQAPSTTSAAAVGSVGYLDAFELELLQCEAAAPGRRLSAETLRQYYSAHGLSEDGKEADEQQQQQRQGGAVLRGGYDGDGVGSLRGLQLSEQGASRQQPAEQRQQRPQQPVQQQQQQVGSDVDDFEAQLLAVEAAAPGRRLSAGNEQDSDMTWQLAAEDSVLQDRTGAAVVDGVEQPQQQQQHEGELDSFEAELLAAEAGKPGRRLSEGAAAAAAAAAAVAGWGREEPLQHASTDPKATHAAVGASSAAAAASAVAVSTAGSSARVAAGTSPGQVSSSSSSGALSAAGDAATPQRQRLVKFILPSDEGIAADTAAEVQMSADAKPQQHQQQQRQGQGAGFTATDAAGDDIDDFQAQLLKLEADAAAAAGVALSLRTADTDGSTQESAAATAALCLPTASKSGPTCNPTAAAAGSKESQVSSIRGSADDSSSSSSSDDFEAVMRANETAARHAAGHAAATTEDRWWEQGPEDEHQQDEHHQQQQQDVCAAAVQQDVPRQQGTAAAAKQAVIPAKLLQQANTAAKQPAAPEQAVTQGSELYGANSSSSICSSQPDVVLEFGRVGSIGGDAAGLPLSPRTAAKTGIQEFAWMAAQAQQPPQQQQQGHASQQELQQQPQQGAPATELVRDPPDKQQHQQHLGHIEAATGWLNGAARHPLQQQQQPAAESTRHECAAAEISQTGSNAGISSSVVEVAAAAAGSAAVGAVDDEASPAVLAGACSTNSIAAEMQQQQQQVDLAPQASKSSSDLTVPDDISFLLTAAAANACSEAATPRLQCDSHQLAALAVGGTQVDAAASSVAEQAANSISDAAQVQQQQLLQEQEQEQEQQGWLQQMQILQLLQPGGSGTQVPAHLEVQQVAEQQQQQQHALEHPAATCSNGVATRAPAFVTAMSAEESTQGGSSASSSSKSASDRSSLEPTPLTSVVLLSNASQQQQQQQQRHQHVLTLQQVQAEQQSSSSCSGHSAFADLAMQSAPGAPTEAVSAAASKTPKHQHCSNSSNTDSAAQVQAGADQLPVQQHDSDVVSCGSLSTGLSLAESSTLSLPGEDSSCQVTVDVGIAGIADATAAAAAAASADKHGTAMHAAASQAADVIRGAGAAAVTATSAAAHQTGKVPNNRQPAPGHIQHSAADETQHEGIHGVGVEPSVGSQACCSCSCCYESYCSQLAPQQQHSASLRSPAAHGRHEHASGHIHSSSRGVPHWQQASGASKHRPAAVAVSPAADVEYEAHTLGSCSLGMESSSSSLSSNSSRSSCVSMDVQRWSSEQHVNAKPPQQMHSRSHKPSYNNLKPHISSSSSKLGAHRLVKQLAGIDSKLQQLEALVQQDVQGELDLQAALQRQQQQRQRQRQQECWLDDEGTYSGWDGSVQWEGADHAAASGIRGHGYDCECVEPYGGHALSAAGLGRYQEAAVPHCVNVRPSSAPCCGRDSKWAYQQRPAASVSRFAGVTGRMGACGGASCTAAGGSYLADQVGDGCASCAGAAWSDGWNAAESSACAFNCPADSGPLTGGGVSSSGCYTRYHGSSSSSCISHNAPPASMHRMHHDGGARRHQAWPAIMQTQLRCGQGARLQQQSQYRQHHQAGQLYGMPIESWVLPGQGSTGHACGRQAGSTTAYHVIHAGSTISSLEAPRTPDPPSPAAAGADMHVHSGSRRHRYHGSVGGVQIRPSTAPDLQRSSAVWMYSSTRSSTFAGAAGGTTSTAGMFSNRGAAGSLWCEVVRECQAEAAEQAMLLSQTAGVAAESRVMAAALRSSWELLHG